jgi:hypothetical protein
MFERYRCMVYGEVGFLPGSGVRIDGGSGPPLGGRREFNLMCIG